jgi:hypothetical protein
MRVYSGQGGGRAGALAPLAVFPIGWQVGRSERLVPRETTAA